jgi:hypothetical protein
MCGQAPPLGGGIFTGGSLTAALGTGYLSGGQATTALIAYEGRKIVQGGGAIEIDYESGQVAAASGIFGVGDGASGGIFVCNTKFYRLRENQRENKFQ